MTAVSRRAFLAWSSAAVAGSVSVAHSRAAPSAWNAEDYFFYDDRFPLAERLAHERASSGQLKAVRADFTPIWNAELRQASRALPLTLRGVTTESFHFCAKTMLEEHARLETHVDRIDRDLYLWLIVTKSPRTERT